MFKLAAYLGSKMIDSVRKTSLNTLRIKKIACGGYFSPNPSRDSFSPAAINSRTKGALEIDAMVGTVPFDLCQ